MRYRTGDHRIVCPCCQNDTFDLDYRQLNTKAATLFNFDWANKEAAILVCQKCTHISWFMREPEADRRTNAELRGEA
ncbi:MULTISPECIES: hypothetical protein [unclassified Sporosarcina]|uniref:hypothetical protein n=1 Tax=unclassified Sporosarcina TaxID=2647733 RepID=UPI00203B5C3B|nr:MULTISPECIES: hypothetical protein [unclassified Sporosarcina]GKV64712.1 hypothetical protein NCCP2331_08650 [Sporosarcina sp. NCCP-2331]GLB54822.1 hypothetical protein NCCP2378_06070 [Sporosarcina sp. NCCP-2378]